MPAVERAIEDVGFCYGRERKPVGGSILQVSHGKFFASVVVASGAAYVPLQAIAVLGGETLLAGLAAACAATTIVGASLAAWRARKIPRWFGQAGIAGGIAVLVVGAVEAGADWTLADRSVFASSLGFMVWVVVTATYLLRR